MCLRHYRARKSIKSRLTARYVFLISWGTMLKKSRFIYEGLVTIFINNLPRYTQQLNTFKGFEICDHILLIKKQPFMLRMFEKCEWLKNSLCQATAS